MGESIFIEIPGAYSRGSFVQLPLEEPGVSANFDVETGDLVGFDFDSALWTEERAENLVDMIFSCLSIRTPFIGEDKKSFMRQQLFKGGSGSGNFGHAGRPGQVGGSAGISGGSSAKPKPEGSEFHATAGATASSVGDVATICNTPDNMSSLAKYNMTKEMLEQSLMISGISDVSYGVDDYAADGLTVVASFYKDGEHIGDCGFTVSPRKKIIFEHMVMNKGSQASGTGKEMVDNLESLARQTGAKSIELFADISVGPYAWAKLGFDYKDKDAIVTARDDLKDYVLKAVEGTGVKMTAQQKRAVLKRIKELKTAKEVAEFDIKELRMSARNWASKVGFENNHVPKKLMMHVGKAFMLDYTIDGHGDWDAVKRISSRPKRVKSYGEDLAQIISIREDWGKFVVDFQDDFDVVRVVVRPGSSQVPVEEFRVPLSDYMNSVEHYIAVMGKFDPYYIGYSPPIESSLDFLSLQKLYNEKFNLYGDVSVEKGGPGSGNFGHSGRPGQVGGSGPGGRGGSSASAEGEGGFGTGGSEFHRGKVLTTAQKAAVAAVDEVGKVDSEELLRIFNVVALEYGYTKKDLEDLSDMLAETSEVVVHCHFSPWSQDDFIANGLVKNQFQLKAETGEDRSSGLAAPFKDSHRDSWEKELFDGAYQKSDEYKYQVANGEPLPLMLAIERPVYGSVRFRGADESESASPNYLLSSIDSTRAQYGDVEIVMKPSVNKRSTCTMGDSGMVGYNHTGKDPGFISSVKSQHNANMVMALLNRADDLLRGGEPDVLLSAIRSKDKKRIATLASQVILPRYRFCEAQIHGGINLAKDVASIRIPSNGSKDHVIAIARKYKIPVYERIYNRNTGSEKLKLVRRNWDPDTYKIPPIEF